MTTRKRRTFEPSLKLEVVRLINEQGQSVQNVSESMGIGQTAIRRWLQQYGAEQSGQAGIGKPLTAEQQRIRQLELQNQQLRQDVSILKKASAFFAREMKRSIHSFANCKRRPSRSSKAVASGMSADPVFTRHSVVLLNRFCARRAFICVPRLWLAIKATAAADSSPPWPALGSTSGAIRCAV